MPEVQQLFAPEHASVPQARRFARTTLQQWCWPGPADDVLTCLSELATNALKHADPGGGGFLLHLVLVDGIIRLEVHDHSRRQPAVQHPDDTSTTGRGLLIVSQLADDWGVDNLPGDAGNKVVWIQFKASAGVAEASC